SKQKLSLAILVCTLITMIVITFCFHSMLKNVQRNNHDEVCFIKQLILLGQTATLLIGCQLEGGQRNINDMVCMLSSRFDGMIDLRYTLHEEPL
ncbi:TPA: hypothetical protein ACV5OD_004954, partial [Citrobacter freundii]